MFTPIIIAILFPIAETEAMTVSRQQPEQGQGGSVVRTARPRCPTS